MISRARALALRRLIEKASESLTDENALEAVELFPAWKSGTAYEYNQRIRYEDKLYRCAQAHTSQNDWTPDVTPALWVEVALPGEIPVWRQPQGAHDAYMIGDKVRYPDENGDVYESVIDYNVFEPGVTGWELVDG